MSEAVGLLANDALLFEPGSQHRYSIWGWVLVSGVIESAAGEPFDRAMTHLVFEPLALERTVPEETEDLDDVAAYDPGSVLAAKLGIDDEPSMPDYSCVAGAGAFVSTPTDLVRFANATMKPGHLKAETIAALQTGTRLASGATTTYALGWTVGAMPLGGKTARMISHRGNPNGGSATLLTFPELGLAIAATANTNSRHVDAFARQLAELFAGGSSKN